MEKNQRIIIQIYAGDDVSETLARVQELVEEGYSSAFNPDWELREADATTEYEDGVEHAIRVLDRVLWERDRNSIDWDKVKTLMRKT